jgi:hypothetical protein
MNTTIKPSYNPKFHQYQIDWINKDGASCAVWGDTEEECLKRYNQDI